MGIALYLLFLCQYVLMSVSVGLVFVKVDQGCSVFISSAVSGVTKALLVEHVVPLIIGFVFSSGVLKCP